MIGLGLLAGGIASLTRGGQERRADRQATRVANIEARGNSTRAARVNERLTGRNDFLDATGDNIRGVYEDITGQTAAGDAADAQREGIDTATGILDPYAQTGAGAMDQMSALMGMGGPEAQQAAYDMIQNSPGFLSSVQQGENAMLQNASATGGLRGGNTQAAMAQFRPQMLSQAIQQQLGGLGGLAGMGMNAASQQAGFAVDRGNVGASQELGDYNLQRSFLGDLTGLGMNIAGMFGGMPPMFGSGGGGAPSGNVLPGPGYTPTPNQSPMMGRGGPVPF